MGVPDINPGGRLPQTYARQPPLATAAPPI